MKQNSKVRQSEIISELQLGREMPQVRMVVELLGMMLEDAKHALISTTGDATLLTQGKAQAIGQLLTAMVRPISQIKPPQQTGE